MIRQGACFTSATIRHIRRIRFSSGAGDRLRPSNSLSGLFFQYDDPLQDSYIGQWFQEVDSLDLEKGDYIVHIRVWYTQALAHYSNVLRTSKHENIGQVLGIEISTFRGSVKRVLCGKTDCSLELDYFVNPLEELVSPSPSLSPK
jgi:hypothetical protein